MADLDFSQPTLFIAECVLVYMDESESEELLKEIANRFSTASFINYEQVNMKDHFGEVMIKNLCNRGIMLPGLATCESLQTQKTRFLNSGFTHACAWTIDELYKGYLNPFEVTRIEKIEPLDERELLTQLLDHYCLVYASKDSRPQDPMRGGLSELTVK